MNRRTRILVAVAWGLIALAAAAPNGSAELTAREVLVVGNALVPESVELAKIYARTRKIDANQILLLKLPPTTDISRETYDTKLAEPIRDALTRKGLTSRIRGICTLYGVPYRVQGGIGEDPEQAILTAARRELKKLHFRLAVGRQLLLSIGKEFPAPRGGRLEPVGLLFPEKMETPTEPLMEINALRKEVDRLLSEKHREVAAVVDNAKRKIARRQLMAMQLEINGRQGLLDYMGIHNPADAPDSSKLKQELREAAGELTVIQRRKMTPATLVEAMAVMKEIHGLAMTSRSLEQLKKKLWATAQMYTSNAAIDSELAMLHWGNYSLRGPAKNPLSRRAGLPLTAKLRPTLMVSRLDGPSKVDVHRMILAAVVAEAKGVRGVCYIDAGGPTRVAMETRNAYDDKLKSLAAILKKHAKMKVVLDTRSTLFGPGQCPDAAVYVGWYSLQKYVDAFHWARGAVGWHVASWEAVHLRDPASNEWCVKMIQKGVTATIGAVAEPMLPAFPEPEDLVPLLMTGKYTLAECYWRAVPQSSWQMMLLGDPLYNPFKNNPQIELKDLPKGLAP